MREDSVRAYNVFRAIGGDFTMASQKAQSEYDILERTHSRLPGPGEYSPLLTDNNKFRGKFGSANPKSELDWIQLRQSALPGPASYRTETAGLGKCIGKSASRSAVISRGNLPTFVDLSMTRASKIPGPGQYKPEVHTIGWRTRQQAPLWVGPPPVTGPPPGPGFFFCASEQRIWREETYWPVISFMARTFSPSSMKRTKP
mmetsp:Transcript_67707/g.181067  ORF Transcript_67707/g.181067 Transcript_67707/m.181067 type:complete len:201 (+) Transcript_67707:52-654(+)